MTRNEKIAFAKNKWAEKWNCDPAVFDSTENVFLASTDTFFEITTFGANAVVRADEAILGWCAEKFEKTAAQNIMEVDVLCEIDEKLRTFGKRMGGEHIGYLHLFPGKTVDKPEGFEYRVFAGDEVKQLRLHAARESFRNAFSPDENKDVLAVAAYDGETIAAIACSDSFY